MKAEKPINSETPIWIYGYFDHSGNAIYVGQTVRPNHRKGYHRNQSRISGVIADSEFKLLRSVSQQNASRIEAQVIAAFRKKGQCKANVNRGYSGSYLQKKSVAIQISSSDGNVFKSQNDAAYFYNVSVNTIYRAIKFRDGVFFIGLKAVKLTRTLPTKNGESVQARPFASWSLAFAACRKANRPMNVCVPIVADQKEVARIYPNGCCHHLDYVTR